MIMLLVYIFPPKKLLTLTVKVNNSVTLAVQQTKVIAPRSCR